MSSHVTVGVARAAGLLRKATALFSLGFVVLLAQPEGQAQGTSSDALPPTGGYLITGNYVVGGVNLMPKSGGNGFLTGTINFDDAHANKVPPTADNILAAFLYWETISSNTSQLTGAKFRGSTIPSNLVKVSTLPLSQPTAPCFASGANTITMFRADVRQLLPLDKAGRRLVNDADLLAQTPPLPLHTVTLPDVGTGNVTPQSAGATLLIVYRDTTQQLTKILLSDGVYVQPQATTMTQHIRGYLQSSSTPRVARMTQLVGAGAPNKSGRWWFNGKVLATDPYTDTSPYSHRTWSNPTVDVSSWMPGIDNKDGYGETVTTMVDHVKTSPYDCLAWAAIIFSTTVPDIDNDGIIDIQEDSSTDGTFGPPWKDANGRFLPDIRAMGASSQHKDLFIEIGAMQALAGTAYGSALAPFSSVPPIESVTDPNGHNHMPTPAVWKMLGEAYGNAPVENPKNPDGSPGIKLHVDVGDIVAYHALAKKTGIPGYASLEADQYFVPSTLARGGESTFEAPCVADTQSPPRWICQFPAYPGTVMWKPGFLAYRNGFVNTDGIQLDLSKQADKDLLAQCQAAEQAGEPLDCRRRFDRVRRDIFHYVLFAHATGEPKSPLPCLDSLDLIDPNTGHCKNGMAHDNPDFHVPKGTSGKGDLPGGDAMVTVGVWDKDHFVGTDFLQASTMMHELGHNFRRGHGGEIGEPNCKPNYVERDELLVPVRRVGQQPRCCAPGLLRRAPWRSP